jgi:hypothetical protein
MALLTVTDASGLGGTAVPVTAFTGGQVDTVPGGAGVNLIAVMAGTPSSVSLTTPETVEGTLAVADRPVTLAANATTIIPIPARYNDPATGLATLTFGGTAGNRGVFRANTQA